MSQLFFCSLFIFTTFVNIAFSAQSDDEDLLFQRVQHILPQQIYLKTATESFTHEYYIALREERLWIRRIDGAPISWHLNDSEQPCKNEWHLIPPSGLPPRSWLWGKDDPIRLRSISADGDNLIAVDYNGQVYYTKLYDPEDNWTEKWGLPPITKKLKMIKDPLD